MYITNLDNHVYLPPPYLIFCCTKSWHSLMH